MKRKILFFLFISVTFSSQAQEIPTPLTEGVVTTTNQRISFKKLRKEGSEIVFYNVSTRSDYRYLPNSIKKIEDKEFNILYINPKFENEPNIKEKYVDPESKLFKPNYPEGIYLTSDDFLDKTPSSTEKIFAGEVDEVDYDVSIDFSNNCNFYYDKNGKKVRNVFAISYKGFLYFQIKAILNNRNKTDRSQRNDYPQSFVRVSLGGNNYFYTEADLANLWDQSLTIAATGTVGSVLLADSLS